MGEILFLAKKTPVPQEAKKKKKKKKKKGKEKEIMFSIFCWYKGVHFGQGFFASQYSGWEGQLQKWEVESKG